MARTIRLALFCLICLGIAGTVKLSFGTSPSAVSAAMIDSALPATAAAKPDAEQGALGKADRLPVFHGGAEEAMSPNAPLPTKGESSSLVPPPPKIVSRHWHDPNPISTIDRKSARRSSDSKKGNKKSDQPVDQIAARRACPEGNALLRTLNLAPSCEDALAATTNRPAR
jgi:hypothetical protein